MSSLRTDLDSIKTSNTQSRPLAWVGSITKIDGAEGHVLVKLKPDADADPFDSDFLIVEVDGRPVPLRVDSLTMRGERSATVCFSSIATVSQAQFLVGCKVLASPSDDGSEDGALDESLVGYAVIDSALGNIGVIADVDDSVPVNPLFVVDTPNGEVLIPAAEEFVVDIDDDARELHLQLPEGLINIDEAYEA